MKKKVIAYVHSHWDREWYREFEIFRMRLVRVFDNILNMLENNTLPSFYFDGQTAALLDYLEIRPEKEDLIKKFIKEKRLFIGPFYCLVDEFLTDETTFTKNIELGLKISKEFGCKDFIGYFADTFGHSACTIPILKKYEIDTAIVWRGCGDIPAEFTWEYDNSQINTINLVRGYFNDIFSTDLSIEQKAEFLKNNLDKIAEKSKDVLLLPIGADHLGVATNLTEQITEVNKLLDDYEITIGTIFDYINTTKNNFSQYKHKGELRDNSKTFILEGCYSSRLDIKQLNTKASHELKKADKLQKFFGNKYENIINYAYKILVQNQAHDSICGCSTDEVHSENITRYKKILQIASTVIDEIKFEQKYNNKKIINLSNEEFSGYVTFKSTEKYPYPILKQEKGFDMNLLCDTQRIPVTEDYTDIYTYSIPVTNVKQGLSEIKYETNFGDVFISDKCLGNSKIFLSIEDNKISIGDKEIYLIDFKDMGDSYNSGPVKDDMGEKAIFVSSKIIKNTPEHSILEIKLKLKDIITINAELFGNSEYINFSINWNNTQKNHLLQFGIDTKSKITTTYSEDLNNIIKREFNPDYKIREHLPQTKGIEAMSNNAPMQRGVWANNTGIITNGITQYEISESNLLIPLLRATGVISNPKNTSRSTPAGPPIETNELQQTGNNLCEFSIFLGGNDKLKSTITTIFNECIIL